MDAISRDHPDARFDRMFADGRIRVFQRKPETGQLHRYIVIESIMLQAMILGKVHHENRCEVFFRMPDCPPKPPNNIAMCAYCPFVSHGCEGEFICPMYTTLHVRGLLPVNKEKQRRREVCEWLKKHEAFIANAPRQGEFKIIPPGRDSLGNEGNQLRISTHEILHFICEFPIPTCKNNPFHYPEEAAQLLFSAYASSWQRAFGGKILKVYRTTCLFPGEMHWETNMIRFKIKMDCDIVNIPNPNDIMGFQLHSFGVEKENAANQHFDKLEKLKLKHGRELVTRTMRLEEFPDGWLSLNYDPSRMQVIQPPFLVKMGREIVKSHHVNLMIKNCWITEEGLMCEVDPSNVAYN